MSQELFGSGARRRFHLSYTVAWRRERNMSFDFNSQVFNAEFEFQYSFFASIPPLLYPSCRRCASSNCSSCSWSSVREWVCAGRTPVCWINCCRLHCLSSLFSSSSSSCLAWDGKEHKTKDDWEPRSVSADSLTPVNGSGCSIRKWDKLNMPVNQ